MAEPASRVLRAGGLWFNGKDSYVQIPDSASLNPRNAITITFWLCLRGHTRAAQNFVRKEGQYILGWISGNYVVFCSYLFDTAWRQFPFSKTPSQLEGAWHFYAVTWPAPEDGRVRNYLDGVLDSVYSFTAPINVTTNPLQLGREPPGYFGWGILDEPRIYSRALSADEIYEIYSKGTLIKDGLVLYLPFYEGEGNIAHDVSGYGNHGTIYGASWVVKKALRVLPKAR